MARQSPWFRIVSVQRANAERGRIHLVHRTNFAPGRPTMTLCGHKLVGRRATASDEDKLKDCAICVTPEIQDQKTASQGAG